MCGGVKIVVGRVSILTVQSRFMAAGRQNISQPYKTSYDQRVHEGPAPASQPQNPPCSPFLCVSKVFVVPGNASSVRQITFPVVTQGLESRLS